MFSTIASVSSLLISFALLCLGNGLQTTLLAVRAAMEGFPEWAIGMMTSSYHLGFALGAFLLPRFIPHVGHIRVFAAFASLASSVALIHLMAIEIPVWIVLRFMTGLSVAALYTVIESWLSALANVDNRGRILSVYMFINLGCIALGQLMLTIVSPELFILFALCSVLVSISLVPVTLSRTKQPVVEIIARICVKRLFRTSPLAFVGCVFAGINAGIFWGLSAIYSYQKGFSYNEIALFISAFMFGGLIAQWPMGSLSDWWNRRSAILLTGLLAVFICLSALNFSMVDNNFTFEMMAIVCFLLGVALLPQYSILLAHAADYVHEERMVELSAGLLMMNSLGCVLGPVAGAITMHIFGVHGFFLSLLGTNLVLCTVILYRILSDRNIPEETRGDYVIAPRTAIVAYHLDPRTAEDSVAANDR